jgi:hypothetical protein
MLAAAIGFGWQCIRWTQVRHKHYTPEPMH